jgi:cytochrome b6-f complex iron-sulfur subunit
MSCTSCPGPSRRTVLAGAGAVSAAGLLAACGGGQPSGPQATTGADDPVVTDLASLREQGSVAFESTDGKAIAVVVGEEVRAFSSVCTHNGCTVVWNAETEQLDCPCHGSRFSAEDGSVLTGPARTPLPAVAVTVDEAEGVLRRG